MNIARRRFVVVLFVLSLVYCCHPAIAGGYKMPGLQFAGGLCVSTPPGDETRSTVAGTNFAIVHLRRPQPRRDDRQTGQVVLETAVGGTNSRIDDRGNRHVGEGYDAALTRMTPPGVVATNTGGAGGETAKPDLVKGDDRYIEGQTGETAHEIKNGVVGPKNGSKYDLYIDKKTGEIFVLGKGGKGEPQPTGLQVPRK